MRCPAPRPAGRGRPGARTKGRPALKPGLLVLHGQRLEDLADAVLGWLAREPLGPLEPETVLVQSNGMAEWFKMAAAQRHGVAAALRVELPARFAWRAYRAILGRSAVPMQLPLDKQPLAWRLMALLPRVLAAADPVDPAAADPWQPLRSALGDGDALRRWQLAQRVADLFDQYQVYRADWLADWAAGHDRLRRTPDSPPGTARAVPDDARWQPALWRALLAALPASWRDTQRPALHQRSLDALAAAGAARLPGLPRRVVLFGSTQLPLQTLELLTALSTQVQVILAVPNPSRYHWADLIDGREALAFERRRHPWRHGVDRAAEPLSRAQAFGHPLLAAWGRQARDFVRQLDRFDDVARSRSAFEIPRIDLFDEGEGSHLLGRLQARIRDLVPLDEQRGQPAPDASDRSIAFHIAHSPQREVEVLHDRLLDLLAHPPGDTPLQPRDIVVMVPDIERFAPAIRAVFGRLPRSDPRHIPWGIADLGERGQQPLLVALEWLLRIDEHRCSVSEWRDAFELPALARRFGIDDAGLELLSRWVSRAGIRWGLDAAHRAALGLAACGDAQGWRFGLRRMLLGFAAGDLPDGFAGIEPLADVQGLQADAAGALDEWVRLLQGWWSLATVAARPVAWVARARTLLAQVFEAQDSADRELLAALDDALSRWLHMCEAAGFDEPVPLTVLREAWLGSVRDPSAGGRFKAGGVTFCTLLPMRAIPFEVVCLLGMEEGAYPRSDRPSEIDLMALPGLARPGDRSRRDDDRQLMLDAVLSARRVFYVSWAGRSVRDNSLQPPSALVAQLRDHLDAAWGAGTAAARTTEHPLQPFSRRAFEDSAAAEHRASHAWEWRAAHPLAPVPPPATGSASLAPPSAWPGAPDADGGALELTLDTLGRWLRQPLKAYLRDRFRVVHAQPEDGDDGDDEPFELDRLSASGLRRAVLETCLVDGEPTMPESVTESDAAASRVARAVARLSRAGELPLEGPGEHSAARLADETLQMLQAGNRWLASHAAAASPVDASLDVAALGSPDGTPGWRLRQALQASHVGAHGAPVPVVWRTAKLLSGDLPKNRALRSIDRARAQPLLAVWLEGLAWSAAGRPARCALIALDAWAVYEPPPPDEAAQTLQALVVTIARHLTGTVAPVTAARTALAWLTQPGNRAAAVQAFNGRPPEAPGDLAEVAVARWFPDASALLDHPDFPTDSQAFYGAFAAGLVADPPPTAGRWWLGALDEPFPSAASGGSDG